MKTSLNPKIIICTIPIRPIPTDYPPIGSISILTAIRKIGFNNSHFYNIDLLRPKYEEVLEYFKKEAPQIIAISAVVSTSYAYTKKLSLDLKQLLPDTTIILGGNLGASAEILLRKTGVDLVCTGEGEFTFREFVKNWRPGKPVSEYSTIRGLAFLNQDNEFVFTEYADPIPNNELFDADWSILEELNQMDYFMQPIDESWLMNLSFDQDLRLNEPHRKNKKVFIFETTKGCVSRCTFCHRWDKGLRHVPVPILMERLDQLIEKHNVGFLNMAAENFGSDKRWLEEFITEIKKRDILWRVGGMRVNSLTLEWMQKMKAAGCGRILCGMETGSQNILKIMEKNTTLEQNKNALKWMIQENISTTIQLVIGMPGETPETIEETANFAAYPCTLSPKWDPNDLSINFAQALPGTPLYEFTRKKGLIGNTIDEEEIYLLRISDKDARDGETTLNLTDFPRLEYERWHYLIQRKARKVYIDTWGLESYKNCLLNSPRFRPLVVKSENNIQSKGDTGYLAEPARSNREMEPKSISKKIVIASSDTADTINEIREKYEIETYPSLLKLILKGNFGQATVFFPIFFWHLRSLDFFIVSIQSLKKYGLKKTLRFMFEYLQWKLFGFLKLKKNTMEYNSLRKILRAENKGSTPVSAMDTLRLGR